MADFLNRLAGRALGAIPLAEPVVPARFSPGGANAPDAAFQPSRPSSESAPEPALDLSESEDRPRPLRNRVDHPTFEAHIDRHASPLDEPDEVPHRPLPQRPRDFTPQESQLPIRDRETAQPSPERVQTNRHHPASSIGPVDDDAQSVTAHRPPVTTSEPAPFAEPRPVQRLAPLVEPMRSTAVQQAESPLAFRQAPPTVRVSIGRIEVHAEIAAPVPARPTQRRSQPSTLSLDEFLSQAGSRR